MSDKREIKTKYVIVSVLLFISLIFTVPQAFAIIDSDVTIDSITVNPTNIDLVCTDAVVSGGTTITGNVLDIDDSVAFDSIDVTTSGLTCDGSTPNNISTSSLTDLTTYNVRITVSTDDSGNSIDTDSFVQPDDTPPTVVSKTVSEPLISDSDDPSTFDAVVTFSEAMDTSDTPTITFSTDVSSTLSSPTGVWSSGDTVYTATYDIADAGVTEADISFTVSGAEDAADNAQVADVTVGSTFDIDTENPTATIGYVDDDLFTTDLHAAELTDVTLTATISEPLAALPLPDITITGANSAGPDPMTSGSSTSFTYIHNVGAGDGTATISLDSATDLAGNLIVSAPSSGADFYIDNTAPGGVGTTIAIQRTDATLTDTDPQRTYVRSVELAVSCDDPDAPDTSPGSGCDLVDVTGTGLVGEATGDFEAISSPIPATLTIYRDDKTATATYRDKAGNVAAPINDVIALDPRIVDVVMSDDGDVAVDGETPFWGVDATFTGTVENIADPMGGSDTVTFDFGSPTVPSVIIDDGLTVDGIGTFSVTDSYPQISLDILDDNPHEPSAKLVDSGGDVLDSTGVLVTASGPMVTVQAHPTAITPDPFDNPNEGNRFFTGGRLSDTLFGIPVTGKLISFEGDGAPTDLADYTTEGILFSDAGGIEINDCDSCPEESPDNIMRLDEGATISPSEKTTYVGLRFRDMGSETVTVRVTNGETPSTITDYTATATPDDIVLFTLSEPFEIETIEIIDVSGEDPAGLSGVKTFGTELGAIHDIDFTTQTSGETSLTFDEGRFYSEGTAQNTAEEFLDLVQVFESDVDYVGTSSTITYSVLESTTAGVGGSATVIADSGKGVASVICANDSDGDALCNGWEGGTSGTGVPFVVGGTTYRYLLPGTSTTVKNLLVEIDSQTSHTPNPTSLANVAATFLAEGVTLLHTVDDTTLTHVNPIKLWTDTNRIDNDDFNSLKNDWFGTASERPTISAQISQVNSISPGTANTAQTITLSGISLSVPTNSITSGATQGKIIATIKVTTGAATTVTPGPITNPTSPAGLTLGAITAASASTSTSTIKLVTVTIPFTTTGPISTTTIPTFTIPITLTSAQTATVAANPGSPQIFTTLLDAKAQAYRYGIWAHSYGSTTSTPSGQAELLGNDFVVTLGVGYGGTLSGHTGSIGNTNQQTGTYAHELGHLLGLKHGGGDDINCKPNYFSIMSYSRQLPTYLGATAWTPTFSSGTHSPLTETSLLETGTNLLGGLATETAVFGSPVVTSPTDVTFNTVLGNADSIDWNSSGSSSGTVSADVNNFGITGCGATTPTDTAYTDFDDSTLMNFNFRSAPSGQLDGISIFASDIDENVVWQSILGAAEFDGLNSPPVGQSVFPISEYEIGGSAAAAGAPLSIRTDIRDEENNPIELAAAFGHVFVSMDKDSLTNGDDPRTEWVQITDNNSDNFGEQLMRWMPDISALELDWLTPKSSADFGFAPSAFSVEGKWYIRVVLYDPDNPDDDPDRPLAGIPNDATSDFLIDNIAPHLPEDVKDQATMQVDLKLPKTMKIDEFLPFMNTLKDEATKTVTKLTLSNAIFTMQDSVNMNYWVDNLKLGSKYGHVALIDEGNSALGLELISKGFFPYDDEPQSVKDKAGELAELISVVDREIDESVVAEAQLFAGTNSLWKNFWVSSGAQDMLEAQDDIDDGDFTEAIGNYIGAWHAAQRAMFNGLDDETGNDGNNNNNNLYGTLGNDDISGLGGKDNIQGNLGDDELFGDAGIDTLYGSFGADYLAGGSEGDYIYGGFDNDWMIGGTGNDQMWGQDGHDFMYGEANDDKLYGGNDNDYLFGGDGKDYLDGGWGNDRVEGGLGVDTLLGDKGNDILISGVGGGKDIMEGGSDNDILVGSGTGMKLKGGSGTDTCYAGPGDTYDSCEVKKLLSEWTG